MKQTDLPTNFEELLQLKYGALHTHKRSRFHREYFGYRQNFEAIIPLPEEMWIAFGFSQYLALRKDLIAAYKAHYTYPLRKRGIVTHKIAPLGRIVIANDSFEALGLHSQQIEVHTTIEVVGKRFSQLIVAPLTLKS